MKVRIFLLLACVGFSTVYGAWRQSVRRVGRPFVQYGKHIVGSEAPVLRTSVIPKATPVVPGSERPFFKRSIEWLGKKSVQRMSAQDLKDYLAKNPSAWKTLGYLVEREPEFIFKLDEGVRKQLLDLYPQFIDAYVNDSSRSRQLFKEGFIGILPKLSSEEQFEIGNTIGKSFNIVGLAELHIAPWDVPEFYRGLITRRTIAPDGVMQILAMVQNGHGATFDIDDIRSFRVVDSFPEARTQAFAQDLIRQIMDLGQRQYVESALKQRRARGGSPEDLWVIDVYEKALGMESQGNNWQQESSTRTHFNGGSAWDTLGVKPGSPIKAIKSAYAKLAKKFHPDLNPDDPAASEKFMKVQEAYDSLMQGT